MEEKNKTKKIAILIGCGILIGIVNGFFGGGGGMICVPVLKHILNLDEKQSHATAIFIMLPISIASTIIYITTGNFMLFETLYTAIGVIVGGIIGAILLKKSNNKTISIIFATIMLIAGFRLILG